ncbi:MAG: Rpn family recombination-promoting nuclease/putative transposase [Planctomycetaceae bacterium]|jgi:hypothetical protein|nr:Rpn family recombination-promoting nuclease/putative transposase [Planctomycetaceae bacterium]
MIPMLFQNLSLQLKLAHPHDLLSRYFFDDTEIFANLLENYGKTPVIRLLDLKSLKCESPTIIDNQLEEVIGDLLYSTKFKNGNHSKVFLFFEHQSTKISQFWISCLKKILKFYEQFASNPKNAIGKGGKFPYPIVVILYNGDTPWGDFTQLKDMLSLPPEVDRDLLWFPVIMIDLTQIKLEDIIGMPPLKALLESLKTAKSGELQNRFDHIIGHFNTVKDDPRTKNWINAITNYTLTITELTKEFVIKSISKLFGKKEAEKMFMSTLEKNYLEGQLEGERKGEIKGEIKGKLEGKKDAVLKLLQARFKKVPDLISRAVNLYSDQIALDSLLVQAATCETLAEFQQNLAHI